MPYVRQKSIIANQTVATPVQDPATQASHEYGLMDEAIDSSCEV
jgi:hypothetical protein